jgi:23S rRNA (uridine2552-2'-O)-methyltransferase
MKKTRTSRQWIQDHINDPYVRLAQVQGYRARSAFKLLEIDARDKLLRAGMTVVDLGAAPGGWCQVVAQKQAGRGRLVAIDLLPMEPMTGVDFIQGDFTTDAAEAALGEMLLGARVDLVLSDMAPNMSGVALRDQARHYELAELGLAFALGHLKPDGAYLVKVFHGAGFEEFVRLMRASFEQVATRKPKASRDRSPEVYMLGRRLRRAELE